LPTRLVVRSTALIAALACSPLAVAVPAEAGALTTCGGLPATIVGTDGNDTRVGTPLRDVVALGGGNDTFDGQAGDDIVCGGSGKDRLAGGAGNDRIYGDSGDDYVIEGAGNDRIVGGSGRDYLSYFTLSTGIRVSNGTTIDGAGHDLTDTETIEGTSVADQMRGGAGADDLHGLTGKDTIDGGAGNDFLTSTGGVIRAGAGSDFVDASGTVTAYLGGGINGATIGAGRPTVVGGPDQDEFNFRTKGTRATVRGGGSDNQIVFLGVRRPVTADIGKGVASWNGGGLRFAGVHTLIGTRRGDVLIGSASSDILYGRSGADVLRAGGGNDTVTGQGGRDSADGGSGIDYCYVEVRRNCEG
jgi:Ca2+-binding RTX toxin-like protein